MRAVFRPHRHAGHQRLKQPLIFGRVNLAQNPGALIQIGNKTGHRLAGIAFPQCRSTAFAGLCRQFFRRPDMKLKQCFEIGLRLLQQRTKCLHLRFYGIDFFLRNFVITAAAQNPFFIIAHQSADSGMSQTGRQQRQFQQAQKFYRRKIAFRRRRHLPQKNADWRQGQRLTR